jgi:hypothetical protein
MTSQSFPAFLFRSDNETCLQTALFSNESVIIFCLSLNFCVRLKKNRWCYWRSTVAVTPTQQWKRWFYKIHSTLSINWKCRHAQDRPTLISLYLFCVPDIMMKSDYLMTSLSPLLIQGLAQFFCNRLRISHICASLIFTDLRNKNQQNTHFLH